MGDCHECGTGIAGPSEFGCRYCGRSFCSSHRMPERHDCPNLDDAETLGPDMEALGDDPGASGETLSRGWRFWVAAGIVLAVALVVTVGILSF